MDSYPVPSGQSQLQGAVADACDFASWALDPAGGAVNESNLYFWTHPWPGPQPGPLGNYLDGPMPQWYNRDAFPDQIAPADRGRGPKTEEIVITAEHIGATLRAESFEEDFEPGRIFVFLAGHGLRAAVFGDSRLQTCFITDEFRPAAGNNAAGLLPCDSLRRSLRNRRFEEVFMFLDCCRSDPQSNLIKALPLCDLADDREPSGWSIGYAAHETSRAYETVGPQVRGAFTKTMMDGLRGWRDPATASLNAEQLDSFVRKNITNATTLGQSPYFDFQPKDAPPIIVAGAPTIALADKSGPIVNLSGLIGGETLEVLQGGMVLVWQGGPYAAGTATVQIPPIPDGLYALRVAGNPERETLFRQPVKDEIYAV